MSSPAAICSRRPMASLAVLPAGSSITARTPGPSWAIGDRNRIGPGARSASSEHSRAAANAWTSRSGVILRAPGEHGGVLDPRAVRRRPHRPEHPDQHRQQPPRGSAAIPGDRRPARTSDHSADERRPGPRPAGTRLCTRWLRWRDRCRYSRASSRAAADQRSSRPSQSDAHRDNPTTAAGHAPGRPPGRPQRRTPAPAARGTPPHAPDATPSAGPPTPGAPPTPAPAGRPPRATQRRPRRRRRPVPDADGPAPPTDEPPEPGPGPDPRTAPRPRTVPGLVRTVPVGAVLGDRRRGPGRPPGPAARCRGGPVPGSGRCRGGAAGPAAAGRPGPRPGRSALVRSSASQAARPRAERRNRAARTCAHPALASPSHHASSSTRSVTGPQPGQQRARPARWTPPPPGTAAPPPAPNASAPHPGRQLARHHPAGRHQIAVLDAGAAGWPPPRTGAEVSLPASATRRRARASASARRPVPGHPAGTAPASRRGARHRHDQRPPAVLQLRAGQQPGPLAPQRLGVAAGLPQHHPPPQPQRRGRRQQPPGPPHPVHPLHARRAGQARRGLRTTCEPASTAITHSAGSTPCATAATGSCSPATFR